MNIHELDSYNLGDAVKFHRRLNPRIWGRDEHLLPEVREKLLAIAEDFQEFLGVDNLDVQDITISGSNAAYSYTKNSDIDLHLVVTMPDNPVYQELFNAKKYQYNDEHNIKIGGADVELYVQPADQAHHSLGIYSIKNNDWISIPQRKRARIDDACVRDKTADLDARIHAAVKSQNLEAISALWDKIKTMRKVGLEQHGEFGCENISFKMLRNSGCIKLLKDAITAAQDRELSLREAPVKKFRYGFSEGHQGQPYSSEDGVAASTKMFCEDNDDSIVQDFIQHVATELGIDPLPEIVLHTDPDWSENNHSFGRYDPESHTLNVSMPNRHVMDVLRTVAHELVHCSQNQQHGNLPPDAGETGSRWENDANARAGIIMRDWANSHPEHFAHDALEEGASGYIPKNKREAKMPQYAMALSVDIHPGQTGKEANKLALNTGRNGEPGLLMKTVNLREYKMPQPSHGPGAIKDLNEPLGPETPPTMPAGTVKVDVSDVYDWYKLGQHISNMKGLGQHDFGQGPPSAILSFGDEDLEHQYIQALKRTGLTTTDIDPVDPKQPPDMPRQKTDPTYNVDEDIENFPIANVRRPNGAIGNQGVNTGQAADVLTHAAGMQVSPDMTMRQMVDALRADPAAQQRLRQFVQQNPVTVYSLPDGTYHLQDGHHRTFLLNLLGDETVPAVVKEDVTEAKTVEFEGLTLKVIKQGHELIVDALDDWGNKVLGHVKFNIGDGRELDPQDLSVDDKYQGQGIARVMYDYVKSLGYTINRSWDQTPAGAGFWNKHRGEDVRVWEQDAAEDFLDEGLRVDVPNEEWLQNAIDYAKQKSPDRNGLPYMGKTTATVRSVDVPVNILKRIPGMRREQQNVRQADLAAIVKIMSDTGKLPLHGHTGEEYKPFINVAYDGSAWVNEGNHRIMAAAKLGWETLPVEISYFDGGERVESGGMYPGKIGLGQVSENFADGKNPGRKGLSKRVGVNTKASVSDLRKTAKNSSGEKQRMAHWLANMKAGRAKAKRK